MPKVHLSVEDEPPLYVIRPAAPREDTIEIPVYLLHRYNAAMKAFNKVQDQLADLADEQSADCSINQ